MSQDLDSSPLPTCPSTPNCIHQAHQFELPASELADHVMNALKAMEAESIDIGQVDMHEIRAVFKAWKYRDDVHIAMQTNQDNTILFIRSASREGAYDFGVNKRRVKRILRHINASIEAGD